MSLKEEYKAYVTIDGTELSKYALVSPSNLVHDVADKLKRANNLNCAGIILFKGGIALDEAKSLQGHDVVLPLLGSDKTYRFGGILQLENTVTSYNTPQLVVQLQKESEAANAKIAQLTQHLSALVQTVKTLDADVRRRPRGWVKLLYPGNLVWIRAKNETLAPPETLFKMHQKWLSGLNASTTVYAVAVNGPTKTFFVDCDAPNDGEEKTKLEIWCVRVIVPAQDAGFGLVQEFDAIGGWTRTVRDTFLDRDEVQKVQLISDVLPTPYDTEHYLTPVAGTVVPTAANV